MKAGFSILLLFFIGLLVGPAQGIAQNGEPKPISLCHAIEKVITDVPNIFANVSGEQENVNGEIKLKGKAFPWGAQACWVGSELSDESESALAYTYTYRIVFIETRDPDAAMQKYNQLIESIQGCTSNDFTLSGESSFSSPMTTYTVSGSDTDLSELQMKLFVMDGYDPASGSTRSELLLDIFFTQ